MDLKPLYDLRERLKAGAIAGCGLIAEDFRLARALEAMKPLEESTPVFARLGQAARLVVTENCSDRGAALLDALALCDAVLTTQGAVAVAGPVEPLSLSAGGGGPVLEVPYSILNPLLEAMKGSGGGRYSFIVETHKERPELFEDYRVKKALTAALAAAYSELADRAQEWLSQSKADVLPLLKDGFDPKGKKEMVRRVRIIEHVAGAAENDFYLSQLELADKDVKIALICALRHEPNNAEILWSAAKTEKGKVKDQAVWTLARLGTPKAWNYFCSLKSSKPMEMAEYMALLSSPEASDWIAGLLCTLLESVEREDGAFTHEQRTDLQKLFYLLIGKSGSAICGFYRRAAALMGRLDSMMIEQNIKLDFYYTDMPYVHERYVFSQVIPVILARAILFQPAEDLTDLAGELFDTYGSSYLAPALMAALLTKKAKTSYEMARPILKPVLPLFGKKKEAAADILSRVFEGLQEDGKTGSQVLTANYVDPSDDHTFLVSRPLAEPLDVRWNQILVLPSVSSHP